MTVRKDIPEDMTVTDAAPDMAAAPRDHPTDGAVMRIRAGRATAVSAVSDLSEDLAVSGNTAGNSYSETDVHLRAAANYINSGHYAEALRVLSDIPTREAQWYYYSALANAGAGNNVTAKEHARTAASMDPNNLQYANLASRLENGGNVYRGMGEFYGNPLSDSGDWCTRLCIANLLCNCLCGGRVWFC